MEERREFRWTVASSSRRELGLDVQCFDRLAYTGRADLPEAEFLATGFTGEEVWMADMEQVLRGSLLVSGFFGAVWWMRRPQSRPGLFRTDQSGSSLGEWRLRVGFIHVPLPCFGGEHYRDLVRISRAPEMRPWVVGRGYDKPIPRRILEEAGVPRGMFGEVKRAASASIHLEGPSALAPTTRTAVETFAAAEGRPVEFRPRHLRLWERVLIKGSRRLGAGMARVARRAAQVPAVSVRANVRLVAAALVRERHPPPLRRCPPDDP